MRLNESVCLVITFLISFAVVSLTLIFRANSLWIWGAWGSLLLLGIFLRSAIGRLRETEDKLLETQISLENSSKQQRNLQKSLQQISEKYQNIYHNTLAMYASIHFDRGKIFECNEVFAKNLGYTIEQITQMTIYDLLPPDMPENLETLTHTIEHGETEYAELLLQKHDGELLDLSFTLYPIYSDSGDFLYYHSVWHDISSRKKSEAEQRRLLKILASTSDVISTAKPSGEVTYVNEAGLKMFGWGENWNDKKIVDAHPEWAIKRFTKNAVATAIESGIWQGENVVQGAQGKEIPVSQILMSHKSPSGKLEYLSTIMRDITDRKNAEEELKKAKEAAEAANSAKSEFLANMSHEIRTPMNAILGFTGILSELIVDPKQKGYLSSIQSSGKSLLSLINDILDLSKVEAGKLELEYRPVNIHNVFCEMEQIFSQKVAEKRLDFQIKIYPDVPQNLILDEVRLRQILLNLVGNAVKFTESGYIRLSLYVDNTREDEESLDLVFSVEDSGIGISEEEQDKIFGAFEQQQGQNSKFGGTGLGLAITKRLVEMMEGDITLESAKSIGSIFSVILRKVFIASIEATENNFFDASEVFFEPATILITDDIAINRELVRVYLENYPFSFLEACNGEEAIELTKNHHPDLILMDIKMPVLNGYEATQIIKRSSDVQYIPVIALTASAMKQHEEQLKGVCDGFLSKPVNKNELITELVKFLPHAISKEEAIIDTIIKEQVVNSANYSTKAPPQNLVELLTKLESEVTTWEELCSTLTINEVEEFGQKMEQLGQLHHYETLATWGKNLEMQASIFDLQALPETLEKYPQILAEIKSAIK